MMEISEIIIDRILVRMNALVAVWRIVWCINAAVIFVGFHYHRYDVAALAGFTCVLSLIATAISRRISKYLSMESQPENTSEMIEVYEGKLAA